ncbi:MAG: nucleotidyl transferase AbiEii/AbiGii toxin family protein [Pirellulales bacterium]|nr:nucleotidyl transferase AbiEii/AbiGii toxin family protein [Pirellulales bacterium]
MTKERPRNMAASVRQRLLNLSRTRGEDFQFVLTRYALERFLYRLSQSEHRDVFVLKGAMLFQLWGDQPHRPTRDLDLLGRGEISIPRFERIVREVCGAAVEDDGMTFSGESVHGDVIKEDQEYEGLRLTLEGHLENARIPIQIDIGFGDVVTPAASEVSYPVLFDFPAPVLLAYSRESVVAEKFQAMVMLGIANSRMKDFYDLWILARQFDFQGPLLCEAIRVTFEKRRTLVPSDVPTALSAEFSHDESKRAQWRAFVNKSKLDTGDLGLDEVATVLRDFFVPCARAVAAGNKFEMEWPPSGPWQQITGI